MNRGFKVFFSVAVAVFVSLVVVGAVYADDDFEDVQQYNSPDFEYDTDTEVQEVTPEVTPAEADPEDQQEENDGEPSEITPEVTPGEADPEDQQEENDGEPSEITPEVTPETTPELTPDATISELITNINHISDGLHADNIHLMLIICIGLGILLGFLIMTRIF